MKKTCRTILLLLTFLLLVLAIPVHADAAVKISKKAIVLLSGQSSTLKITGTEEKVTWSSNRKSVATVSKKGKVTAKKAGIAVIKAKAGKKTLKCKVAVQTPYFRQNSISLTSGQTTALTLAGTNQRIKWSSSDQRVVIVNSAGTVLARSAGTAVITATVLGKEFTCKVVVRSAGGSSGGSSSGGSSSGGSSGGYTGSGGEPSMVWVTASGTKYHRTSTCSNMKNPSYISLSAAKASGRGPCSKCF